MKVVLFCGGPGMRIRDYSESTMDTLRDRQVLEDMVERGETPWLPRSDVRGGVAP